MNPHNNKICCNTGRIKSTGPISTESLIDFGNEHKVDYKYYKDEAGNAEVVLNKLINLKTEVEKSADIYHNISKLIRDILDIRKKYKDSSGIVNLDGKGKEEIADANYSLENHIFNIKNLKNMVDKIATIDIDLNNINENLEYLDYILEKIKTGKIKDEKLVKTISDSVNEYKQSFIKYIDTLNNIDPNIYIDTSKNLTKELGLVDQASTNLTDATANFNDEKNKLNSEYNNLHKYQVELNDKYLTLKKNLNKYSTYLPDIINDTNERIHFYKKYQKDIDLLAKNLSAIVTKINNEKNEYTALYNSLAKLQNDAFYDRDKLDKIINDETNFLAICSDTLNVGLSSEPREFGGGDDSPYIIYGAAYAGGDFATAFIINHTTQGIIVGFFIVILIICISIIILVSYNNCFSKKTKCIIWGIAGTAGILSTLGAITYGESYLEASPSKYKESTYEKLRLEAEKIKP